MPRGRSFWLHNVALGVFVATLVVPFLRHLEKQSDAEPQFTMALFLMLGGISVVTICIWQLVGLWRAAVRVARLNGRSLWTGLAKVYVIVAVITALVELFR